MYIDRMLDLYKHTWCAFSWMIGFFFPFTSTEPVSIEVDIHLYIHLYGIGCIHQRGRGKYKKFIIPSCIHQWSARTEKVYFRETFLHNKPITQAKTKVEHREIEGGFSFRFSFFLFFWFETSIRRKKTCIFEIMMIIYICILSEVLFDDIRTQFLSSFSSYLFFFFFA